MHLEKPELGAIPQTFTVSKPVTAFLCTRETRLLLTTKKNLTVETVVDDRV